MRAALLVTPGEAPVVREHPDPLGIPGRTLVTVTAAPIVPLDQLAATCSRRGRSTWTATSCSARRRSS